MKLFVLSFFLLLPVWAKTGKVSFSDQAVFKVEEKVYLLSDVSKLGGHLKTFRCLLPQSFLLESLELDTKHQDDFENFSSLGIIDLQEEGFYFHKLLKLAKLEVFLNKETFEIDKKTLRGIALDKCGKLGAYENWPSDLKELFRLEGYWNDRFAFESIKLTEREMNSLRLQKKGQALNKLLEEEKFKRSRESALAFIKTVEKQVSHDIFF